MFVPVPSRAAVNSTGSPAQIVVPGDAVIFTDVGHCPHPKNEERISAQKVKTFKNSFITIFTAYWGRGAKTVRG